MRTWSQLKFMEGKEVSELVYADFKARWSLGGYRKYIEIRWVTNGYLEIAASSPLTPPNPRVEDNLCFRWYTPGRECLMLAAQACLGFIPLPIFADWLEDHQSEILPNRTWGEDDEYGDRDRILTQLRLEAT